MIKGIKVVALVIVAMLVVMAISRTTANDPTAPRFTRVTSQPVGPFGREQYDWGGAVPFQSGKVWIETSLNRTNMHVFLCDLEKRRVEGELFHAAPIFLNEDQTKLFCEGPPSQIVSMKDRMIGLFNTIAPTGMQVPTNRVETFWILDLRNNLCTRVGKLSQVPGTGSRWVPSPGFRYAYTKPTTGREADLFLCDLEADHLEKITCPGQIQGWWDDHDILVKDSGDNFVLLDVRTGKTSKLFTADALAKVLKENHLPEDPAAIGSFSSWNGRGYDFYFFEGKTRNYRPDSGTSFLLKADPAGPSFRLHSRDFHFGYLGSMNEEGTQYVHNGERGATGDGGNGAVLLRDLRDNSERALIPADNVGQYALARPYHDSVIFWRNRVLWKVDLKGTNMVRLLVTGGDSQPGNVVPNHGP